MCSNHQNESFARSPWHCLLTCVEVTPVLIDRFSPTDLTDELPELIQIGLVGIRRDAKLANADEELLRSFERILNTGHSRARARQE